MTAHFKNELLDRIRAGVSDDPNENVVALSLALVEQAPTSRDGPSEK
jgi:hypothetical protein